jgi:hypothetical protein
MNIQRDNQDVRGHPLHGHDLGLKDFGLTNPEGVFNCFFNVVVQMLWHLKPFREAMEEFSQLDF